MAKNDASNTQIEPAPAATMASPPLATSAPVTAPAEFPLSLDEFCTRASLGDPQVEILGAFNYVEKKAGRTRDTETAFKARLEAFRNQPA